MMATDASILSGSSPADLWRALAAVAAAKAAAIRAGDADGVDTLIAEKERLDPWLAWLSVLSQRDITRDVAADATLPKIIAAAQASEQAAEAALTAAQEQARIELAALRARRTAQDAFRPGTAASAPAPRFFDRQS